MTPAAECKRRSAEASRRSGNKTTCSSSGGVRPPCSKLLTQLLGFQHLAATVPKQASILHTSSSKLEYGGVISSTCHRRLDNGRATAKALIHPRPPHREGTDAAGKAMHRSSAQLGQRARHQAHDFSHCRKHTWRTSYSRMAHPARIQWLQLLFNRFGQAFTCRQNFNFAGRAVEK